MTNLFFDIFSKVDFFLVNIGLFVICFDFEKVCFRTFLKN